jgi:hypothetical protein
METILTYCCRKCRQTKDISCFSKDSTRKDGINYWCKDCVKSYRTSKSSYFKVKDKEKKDRYTKEGRDYDKKRYQRNREKLLEQKKEYGIRNRELLRNKARSRYVKRTRKVIDPEIRLISIRMRSRLNSFLRARGLMKTSHTFQLVGISPSELNIYLGKRPGKDYHIDHICPLSQAESMEELYKLCTYKNLRWLSASENISKGHRRTIESEAACMLLLNRGWKDTKQIRHSS